jgi:hypothetical protein
MHAVPASESGRAAATAAWRAREASDAEAGLDFRLDDSLDQAPQATHELALQPPHADKQARIALLALAEARYHDFGGARQTRDRVKITGIL